jgi:ADP-ribose pyrophosphatase
MYTYLATGLFPSALNPDADEFLHISRIPYDQVLEMMRSGKIQDAKTLATLALALPILGFPS